MNNKNIKIFINESASDIMYHFTYLQSLYQILKTNTINMTAAFGSKSDMDTNRKKFFFLSTTRSRSSGFKKGNVKIVLNGKLLKNNYKIYPTEYWQYSKNPDDWGSARDYAESLKSMEQEDRIVSDKSEIENAEKYIVAVHCYIGKDSKQYNILSEIKRYCDLYNILLYVYDNEKNYLNQIKPIDINDVLKANTEKQDSYTRNISFNYNLAAFLSFNSDENYKKITEYLNDPEKIKKLDDVLKERANTSFSFNSFYNEDFINYITASVHKIRTYTDTDSKFLLKLMAYDMKKNKVYDIKSYFKKKQYELSGKRQLSDYKKDIYSNITSKLYKIYESEIYNKLHYWIEINEEYYNKAYESDELMNILNEYFNKFLKIIKEIVFDEKRDIFESPYLLSDWDIKNYFNTNEINIKNSINITDASRPTINDDTKEIFRHLVWKLGDISYNIVTDAKNNYDSQFR